MPSTRVNLILSAAIGLYAGDLWRYTWKGSAAVGLGVYLFLDAFFPEFMEESKMMNSFSSASHVVVPFSIY